MTEQKDHSEKVKEALLRTISLLIIGLGVGWLAGLSVSPVATILISGLLGVAIAVVGILSISLKHQNDKGEAVRSVWFEVAEEISIGSLALIVFGIALGVSLGICARTHNFLGIDDELALNGLRQELNELQGHCDNKKWSELGIDKQVVAQRILDKYYPKGGVAKKSAATDSAKNIASSKGALSGSISDDDCKQLSSDSPSGKRDYIKTHSHKFPEFVPLLDKSDEELEQAIHSKCSSSSE